MKANYIHIKGDYNIKKGVDSLVVTKTIYTGEGTLDYTKEILFTGDINNLSETDDPKEIKEKLAKQFGEDGFEVRFSLS